MGELLDHFRESASFPEVLFTFIALLTTVRYSMWAHAAYRGYRLILSNRGLGPHDVTGTHVLAAIKRCILFHLLTLVGAAFFLLGLVAMWLPTGQTVFDTPMAWVLIFGTQGALLIGGEAMDLLEIAQNRLYDLQIKAAEEAQRVAEEAQQEHLREHH